MASNTSFQPQQDPQDYQWLELCIRSGANTFKLGEIDVTPLPSDQAIFAAIKRKYEQNRPPARLLGRFAYRVPVGGIAVQFRKDKQALPSGSTATASIMCRPSMPSEAEAQQYRYQFDPVPMDEPAIDLGTSNHYFHKSHDAKPTACWMERFPLLHDASLYWRNEKLAKGWGFEIVEERNWILLFAVLLAALVLSGAIGGVCSWLWDKSVGIALGAWLTAVEAFIVAAVFMVWTS